MYCKPCIFGCEACTNGGQCSSCASGYVLNTTSKLCECPVGQILLISGICYIPYSNPCDSKPLVWTINGTCTDNCGNGFYKDASLCKPCFYGCSTCIDGGANACMSCTNGYELNSLNGLCFCPVGKFISGSFCVSGTSCGEAQYANATSGRCEKCDFGCQVCSNGQTCTTCYAPYIIDVTTIKCKCPGLSVLLLTGDCYSSPDPCAAKPLIYTDTGLCTASCATGYY